MTCRTYSLEGLPLKIRYSAKSVSRAGTRDRRSGCSAAGGLSINEEVHLRTVVHDIRAVAGDLT